MTTSHVVSYRLSDTTYKQAIAFYKSTHQKAPSSHNAIFRSYVLEALASSSTTETLTEIKDQLCDFNRDLQCVQRSMVMMQELIKLCWSKYVDSISDQDEKLALEQLLEDLLHA
ncbi:hypothetical protein H6F89_34435 [Cyanobacteria bacterium FACHB-63]|nr:hypothetical protein [Cyanobacteria bacterium FACHB-63]